MSAVTSTFYYVFIIFLTCYNNLPKRFIENRCQVLLPVNHLKISAFFLTEHQDPIDQKEPAFLVPREEELMPADVALLLAENLARNEFDPMKKFGRSFRTYPTLLSFLPLPQSLYGWTRTLKS